MLEQNVFNDLTKAKMAVEYEKLLKAHKKALKDVETLHDVIEEVKESYNKIDEPELVKKLSADLKSANSKLHRIKTKLRKARKKNK